MARTSPYRHKVHLRSPRSSSQPWSKSPLHRRRNPGDFTRRNVPRPSNNSTRNFRTRNLQFIREESPSPAQRRPRTSFNSYRSFGPDEDTRYDDVEPSEVEDDKEEETLHEDSFFYWEEESTLLSDLMEEVPDDDKDQRMEYLANSLQNSFDIRGKELKKEIAETLVPTVNRVKALYRVLDEKVDISFGKGVIIFNNACKEAEAMAIKEQDDLKHAYATTKGKVEGLLIQLREAYTRRDRLWTELEKAIDAIAEPTLESLRNMPGKIEHTIANLERHAKKLEKDDAGSTTAAEIKVKGILSKMS